MKFAQYLKDTQTPEWKKAYIDYRGLKKKITAIRRAQQGQQFNIDTESPDEAGSQTPDAPPATPRPSFSSSVPTEGVHVTPRPPTRERSESTAVQSRPVTPRNKKGLTISTSGIHHNESAIADSPSFTRRNTAKTDEIAHSTGVDGHTMPELPRRPSLFSRGSFSVARSISSRGGIAGLYNNDNVRPLKPMPIHELMTHLSPPEVAFFILLDAQLDKVEDFYTSQEKEALERGRMLQEQLAELKEHRRLFLAARAKVPWAAALAAAFRPNRKQLKVTRTMSLQDDNNRPPKRSSKSVIDRLWTSLKSLQQSTNTSLRREPSQISSPCDIHDAEEKFDPTRLSPPVGNQDKVSESGIRFADTRSTASGASPPRSPLSPSFGPGADNYLYAKRKLKKAVMEHYRHLELLHNYRVLNLTGFRKALKKFEKVTRIPAQDQYMAEKVEKSGFASDKTLKQLMKETEDMFSISFFHGNKKKAMKRLRGGTRVKSHHFSTYRSGFLMGLAIPAVVSGLFHAFQEETMEAMPGWEALMMVYAILLVPTLFATVVGLNLLVWARSRINYVFIFELNVATCLDYREYFEIPTILLSLLAYAFWLSFTMVGYPTISPSLWPLVWLGAVALVMWNPLPIFFRPSRYWLTRMVGRLFLSGTRRVEFTDFWLGDQFCSLVFTLSNMYFFGCVYADGFTSEWKKCSLESKYWPVAYILGTLPFIIRLVQSIKRYFDSGLATHLINAGKYGSGILMFLFYNLWRHHVSYAIYSLTWDFLMDWSVLRLRSPHVLLRPDLVYSNHVSLYYLAILSNILLRFTWVIYLPSEGPDMFLRTFIVAILEMLRRCQWNFYRLENEHLGNMDQYRVTREVPLPYLFDDPHQDDRDEDDDEDAKN
ncbi:EXS family protein/ERD1/XPR1/SYG1 family protein [Coprinopsis cinerea okayama7|uniref:EXS family protein/ERD1/XPR1/SYG1 family protein n=1 Tax=Coprinopsis cinerea (strain Okayama-7 / 130 / ATCC MYA-4618 / FGSC 9003) TaxID=240176 RepID=A8NCI7_COPC7|nr:EXS family protein/ERD1/XPR1/SYG1 family protein [Coprinopsis cinerea okayama7\|eukprot:XP_001832531.2 EXS family protein/ERD1/XPR1/SYG1 family protein [Coprinopsis cinerea okayama7\